MRFHPEQLGFHLTLPDTWVKRAGIYRFRLRRNELYKWRVSEQREHDHWLAYSTWQPGGMNLPTYRDLNMIVREAEFKDVAMWGSGYMLPRANLAHVREELIAHDFFVAHAADEYRKFKIDQLVK